MPADHCWTNGVAYSPWKANGVSPRIGAGVRLMVAGALSWGIPFVSESVTSRCWSGSRPPFSSSLSRTVVSVPPIAPARGVSRNWLSAVAGCRCSTTLSALDSRRCYELR
jgi:hypothetical protein